jgi:ABC-type multidrug transport system fused ATPase/permease subunit
MEDEKKTNSISSNITMYQNSSIDHQHVHYAHLAGLSSYWYAVIYITITLCVVITGLINTLYMFSITLKASENLHHQLYKGVTRSPIRFFDTTPTGKSPLAYLGVCKVGVTESRIRILKSL